VVGVFTRCEEVGLIGATLLARQGLLPPQTVVVSLETSRALPGAEIGGGPVIRVGDATMAFHPQGEALLRRARALLLERDPGARVQRQLMSGGTCEAVAYSLAGYVTTGVAFPLGNYHNAAPDGTIGAEYIHRADLETGAELLMASAECVAAGDAPDPAEARLSQRADQASERLRRSAAGWRLR
jgi:endoglucanase